MFENKRIAVVVPAYKEETQIGMVIRTMPDYVDQIIIIDDRSPDKTSAVVAEMAKTDTRVVLIRHEINQGVGGAIVTGYKHARDQGFDATVVMAGDGQMDPADLPALLQPVVRGEVDYCKGNRLFTGEAYKKIPAVRYFGNAVLSLFTKVASGYWHVADSQTGYTVINLKMLKLIDWDGTYKRYGCPNDYLVKLNIYNAKVRDVPIRPVYGVGEKSKIRLHKVIPRISLLLLKLFFRRMFEKYVIRDFHPLVLFYFMGVILFFPGLALGIHDLIYRIWIGPVAATSALFDVFLTVSGIQFLLFAMFMDMEVNREMR